MAVRFVAADAVLRIAMFHFGVAEFASVVRQVPGMLLAWCFVFVLLAELSDALCSRHFGAGLDPLCCQGLPRVAMRSDSRQVLGRFVAGS